jgi:Putative Zn-dependent protease, contains TPR repeats
MQQGKLDEAISLLQAAVGLRPDNSPAQENLAKALLQKGRVPEALVHYRKLVELQPDNFEVTTSWVPSSFKTAASEKA